jgi:glutamyl/glutaminyl-tRNA synthetase
VTTAKTGKRTRIAPTPSGFLHIGNVLSFVITASLAEKTGASVLLRIDDLDRDRADKKYVLDIFDTLQFLSIPWNEGPRELSEYEKEYAQFHRMPLYSKMLQELRDGGHVFGCDCSRSVLSGYTTYPGTCRNKNIPLDSNDINWRLRTNDKQIAVKTGSGIRYESMPAAMQDFVIRKKDGFPAYQLASVCDDIYFGVDLVVRGEDLLPSTIAQLYLASLLADNHFADTTFYHHPLLMEDAQSKLSKSAGATSVQFLRAQGKTPADIYTIIANRVGIQGTVPDWPTLADRISFFYPQISQMSIE